MDNMIEISITKEDLLTENTLNINYQWFDNHIIDTTTAEIVLTVSKEDNKVITYLSSAYSLKLV